MRGVAFAAACAALLVGGCVHAPSPQAPPPALRAVAVVPPVNLTGNELVVEGGGLLEKYVLETPVVTVPDVLAAESRRQLEARGVEVLAAGKDPTAPELHLELRRWEPDAPFKPSYIIVSLAVTLVEPADHRVLWSAEHPSRPVPTQGAVSLGAADLIATAKVITELLAPLRADSR